MCLAFLSVSKVTTLPTIPHGQFSLASKTSKDTDYLVTSLEELFSNVLH
jgi:hypothetical protein